MQRMPRTIRTSPITVMAERRHATFKSHRGAQGAVVGAVVGAVLGAALVGAMRRKVPGPYWF